MNRDEFAAWLEGQRYTAEKEGFSTLRPMILAIEDADMILAALRTPDGDEAMVEKVARAICSSIGLPPDDEVAWGATDTKTLSRWKAYTEQAAAAIAALSASRPVGEVWRPIETAPKDGRRVLLWSEIWTGPSSGIWVNAWTVGYDLPPFLFEPTHWQPLPEPPRSHAEDSSE